MTDPRRPVSRRPAPDDPKEALSEGTARQRGGILGPALVVGAAVLGALAVNLVILAIGQLCGGDFSYTQSGKTETVNAEAVTILTGLPLLTGLSLTTVLAPIWPVVPKLAAVVGPGLSLVTIGVFTVPADFDTVSTIFLALMHVALALITLVAVTAVEVRARRRIGARPKTDAA